MLLVLFIIFLPKGILGSVLDRLKTQPKPSRDEMSKKSSQPLGDELKPYVAPFRYDGTGEFHLKSHKTNEKGGLDKDKATKIIEANRERLNDFQEKLYAQDRWSLLLIFQGMDAAGKDSAIKSCIRGVNPQGCEVTAFKQPSTQGTRPRFPVAQHDRAAGTRPHRHLQSLVITRNAWWCACTQKFSPSRSYRRSSSPRTSGATALRTFPRSSATSRATAP